MISSNDFFSVISANAVLVYWYKKFFNIFLLSMYQAIKMSGNAFSEASCVTCWIPSSNYHLASCATNYRDTIGIVWVGYYKRVYSSKSGLLARSGKGMQAFLLDWLEFLFRGVWWLSSIVSSVSEILEIPHGTYLICLDCTRFVPGDQQTGHGRDLTQPREICLTLLGMIWERKQWLIKVWYFIACCVGRIGSSYLSLW